MADPTFYPHRYRSSGRKSLLGRLWEFHDDHPLPPFANRAGRRLLHYGRRAQASAADARYQKTTSADPAVPTTYVVSAHPFEPLSLGEATAWFQHVHEANEAVRCPDGSWEPQPFSRYAGMGISIEEVALRIPGYLAAFCATGVPEYLDRAMVAGDYLLRHRLFSDGHLLLQAHLSIDFTYSLAGVALIRLWEQDPSREDFFTAACKIGNRLLEHHISGSVNHAAIPAQLLGPLYRYTGELRYLRATHKRVLRSVLPFQQATGDWDGHEGRIWYQGVNVSSLIAAYISTPFTLEYASFNDRIASTLTAAVNRLIVAQDELGSLSHTRMQTTATDEEWAREVVTFQNGTFRADQMPGGYRSHGAYEMDALATAYEQLHAAPCVSAAHGYAAYLARSKRLWRLEFNTLGAGRYLGLLAQLDKVPPAARQHGLPVPV